jgi:hypothetical protein
VVNAVIPLEPNRLQSLFNEFFIFNSDDIVKVKILIPFIWRDVTPHSFVHGRVFFATSNVFIGQDLRDRIEELDD